MLYRTHSASFFPHNLTYNCESNREYRPLCIAELMGHDTEFMIKTEFERSETARWQGRRSCRKIEVDTGAEQLDGIDVNDIDFDGLDLDVETVVLIRYLPDRVIARIYCRHD